MCMPATMKLVEVRDNGDIVYDYRPVSEKHHERGRMLYNRYTYDKQLLKVSEYDGDMYYARNGDYGFSPYADRCLYFIQGMLENGKLHEICYAT